MSPKKHPTVSIITPSLNQGRFIEDTITSLWSQKGNFYIQHLVMDGGSTDQTIQILKNYNRRLQSGDFTPQCLGISFKWLSKKDKGQSHALNKGIKKMTGDYFSWLNSDDYYADNTALMSVITAFQQHPKADIITANLVPADTIGNVIYRQTKILNTTHGFISDKNLKQIVVLPQISQPSTFLKTAVMRQFPLDESLHYSMDWDLWIRAQQQGYKFYKLNKTLAHERQQPQAKTIKHHLPMYQEWIRVYRNYDHTGIEMLVFYKHILVLFIIKSKIYKLLRKKINAWLIFFKGLRP